MSEACQIQRTWGSLAEELAGMLALNIGLPAEAIPVSASTPLFGAIPELDSMSVVTFLVDAEERYGIVIHDDEIDASVFESLGSLTYFIHAKLGG